MEGCNVCTSDNEVMYIYTKQTTHLNVVAGVISGTSALAICIKCKQVKFCPNCGRLMKEA